ncbi:MAG: V-type ATP synthase subunit D [Candidatus Bathyarchaeia archaeon]|nr:V-type ATP synthase subunit D [Candidatus Bathyarchaeota archaeon]
MAAVIGAKAKPTRGFLLQLKRRVGFIEEGYKLLEMKRDELAKELRSDLEELASRRIGFEEKVEEALDAVAWMYASLGSMEASSWINPGGGLELEVLPRSVMGIQVPYVKILHMPEVRDKFKPVVRAAARKIHGILNDLVSVAELEARIERVAEDLEKTNRQVNALEKIVIPGYKRMIKYIEDMLEEAMLEEFTRTKFVKALLSRRRP